jgi:hypothetical protein
VCFWKKNATLVDKTGKIKSIANVFNGGDYGIVYEHTESNSRGTGASNFKAEVSQVGKWVRYVKEVGRAGQGKQKGQLIR